MTIVVRCFRCRVVLTITHGQDPRPGRRTALTRTLCPDCRLEDQLIRERGAAIRKACQAAKNAL